MISRFGFVWAGASRLRGVDFGFDVLARLGFGAYFRVAACVLVNVVVAVMWRPLAQAIGAGFRVVVVWIWSFSGVSVYCFELRVLLPVGLFGFPGLSGFRVVLV